MTDRSASGRRLSIRLPADRRKPVSAVGEWEYRPRHVFAPGPMLFSGKGTPDCRRSFPIKCRACFGRVGLRDGYAVNGSSVFAESGFERNRSLFQAIVRIVVARLIYGGRLTIPAGFRERLCRTTPPIPYVRHGRLFRSAGEIWLRWRRAEKALRLNMRSAARLRFRL